jgi:hypothetical protein
MEVTRCYVFPLSLMAVCVKGRQSSKFKCLSFVIWYCLLVSWFFSTSKHDCSISTHNILVNSKILNQSSKSRTKKLELMASGRWRESGNFRACLYLWYYIKHARSLHQIKMWTVRSLSRWMLFHDVCVHTLLEVSNIKGLRTGSPLPCKPWITDHGLAAFSLRPPSNALSTDTDQRWFPRSRRYQPSPPTVASPPP